MKIKHLPLIIALVGLIVLTASVLSPNGAPPAKTGSPGDGSNCTECHGGTATTTAGLITSNIPSGGYVPGTTYQITATNTLTGAGKYGFEVSPQNTAGTLLGTLIAGSGSQLVGSNKYVTHLSASTTTSAWTFGWVAPASGTGAVTFYGAFAKGKPGPVTKSTLVVQEAVASPGAAGPITGPASVCKNSSATYSVGTIAGATSYVWTAPAGATISSGQGSTSVSILFGASAVSGGVAVYGSNTAGNGTPSQLAVTVNSAPAAPAIPDGPSQVNLQNTTTSNFSTAAVATSYTWQISPANAGTIAGVTANATVTWNSAFQGVAEIKVRGSNSCGDGEWSASKVVQVINTTGIDNSTSGINILTETGGQISIEMNTESAQANVMILDLSGRLIAKTTIPGKGTQVINKNLNTGIYIVMVNAGSSVLKKKIFIN
jgi:hypothetical protein